MDAEQEHRVVAVLKVVFQNDFGESMMFMGLQTLQDEATNHNASLEERLISTSENLLETPDQEILIVANG